MECPEREVKPSWADPPRISPCPLGSVQWLCGIFVANTADWAGFAGFPTYNYFAVNNLSVDRFTRWKS
jgi:hypothetical protein